MNTLSMYLSVTLQSIIDSSSEKVNYDVVLLVLNHNKDDESLLMSQIKEKSNFRLRFIDMQLYLSDENNSFFKTHSHFTSATYLRFFIPRIFQNYSRVLYLDSDIVVRSSLIELFDTDLGDNYLAAARDPWVIHSYLKGSFKAYFENVLKIEEPTNYFNAGVLLFNLEKFKKSDFVHVLIETLKNVGTPKLVDQDILNIVFHNKVKLIDSKWNFTVHAFKVPGIFKNLPVQTFENFYESSKNPHIIHYTSADKPWNSSNVFLRDQFWESAKNSPYYHDIAMSFFTSFEA